MVKLNKKLLVVSALALIIIAAIVGVYISQSNRSTPSTSNQPEFSTITPEDKSIDTFGGWKRVSPSSNDPVYAYTDSINQIAITVSQQQLPDSFKDDPEAKISELARSYNATEKATAAGTTVYIGSSSKGPQSIIFSKNDLLILIKSEEKIQTSSWADYISALR